MVRVWDDGDFAKIGPSRSDFSSGNVGTPTADAKMAKIRIFGRSRDCREGGKNADEKLEPR